MAFRTLVFCCTVCLTSSFRLHNKYKKKDGKLVADSRTYLSGDSQADLKPESISEVSYKPLDLVDYYSDSKQAWVPTAVAKVDASGVYVQIRPPPHAAIALVPLHKLRYTQPSSQLHTAVQATQATNQLQGPAQQPVQQSKRIVTVATQPMPVVPPPVWHFEADVGSQRGIMPCAANLFKELMIETVSERCCQIEPGIYRLPWVPKHCYTILSLYDRRSPQSKWWAILELFSSDEHGSEEEGDATIACALSNSISFETSEAAAYSHVCHKKNFLVGHIQRHPHEPKNIFDLNGVHDFTVQYLRAHPHYDVFGYNCQWYSISLLNQIAATNYWRKQATSAKAAGALPEGALEKVATSAAAIRSDGNEHHNEEHD